MTAREQIAEGMLEAAAIVGRIRLEFEDQAAAAGSGSERGHFESSAGVASSIADAIRGAATAASSSATSTEELSRLSEHLLQNFGAEVAEGESAVDAAIRLLNKKGQAA